MANYQLEQTGAEVQALLNAVESPDTTPAAGSSNLITSGAVQAAVAGVSAEVTALGQEVDEGLYAKKASANLFDWANKDQVTLINGSGVFVAVAGCISYRIAVPSDSYITIDRKTEGNRFQIMTSESLPVNGGPFIRNITATGYQSYTIKTAANEHYLVIYVSTGAAVDLSQMRVYAGTEWVASDVLRVDALAPSITTEYPPKTIFDASKDTYLPGFVTAAGAVDSSDTNWVHSDYLAVEPSHTYKIYFDGFVAAYNDLKQVISGGGYTGSLSTIDHEYTTPANCAYIIFSAKIVGVSQGSLYAARVDDTNPTYKEIADERPKLPLVGKRIVCFGDSNTGNLRYGWPLMLQKITGAITYNVGFGGCRMSVLSGSDPAGTNPFSMARLADAIVSGDWSTQNASPLASGTFIKASLDLLKTIDFDTIDAITISYGTNELGYPQDNPDNPEDVNTYGGAYRYAMHKLMAAYPHLSVIAVTPIYEFDLGDDHEDSDTYQHPTYGGKLTDNVATLIQVSEELKVPCIDMYHTMSVNKYNRDDYYQSGDGTHLNYRGLERYASVLAQGMSLRFTLY